MEAGQKVRVIDENGQVAAVGIYQGKGFPSKDLNAKYPQYPHYAVWVNGQTFYFPSHLSTLQKEG
jgi:hypothetical protein